MEIQEQFTCYACGNAGHMARDCKEETHGFSAKKESNCYKCGMAGHFSRNCSESGNMERKINCYGCGQEGHLKKDCKADPKKSYDQVICYECKETGHLARNCKSTSGCFKCGSKEHFARDCMEKEVDGYLNPQCCYICGKSGHLAKTCTEKRDSINIACYNCGELEHFAKDCTNKASATMGGGNAVIVKNCYTCGEIGHVSRNCNTSAKRFRGDIGEKSNNLASFNCFRCGEYGHVSKQCQSVAGNSGDLNTAFLKNIQNSPFEQGLVPKEVVGATEVKGKLMFLVTWIGSEEVSVVTAEEANIKCAPLVFKYFESRTVTKKET